MFFENAFSKVGDVVDTIKDYDIKDLKELAAFKRFASKEKEVSEMKKNNILMWILIIVGIVVVCAVAGYLIYKFLAPKCIEAYDDDYEDFDDDFFEDEDLANWDDSETVEVKSPEADTTAE